MALIFRILLPEASGSFEMLRPLSGDFARPWLVGDAPHACASFLGSSSLVEVAHTLKATDEDMDGIVHISTAALTLRVGRIKKLGGWIVSACLRLLD